MRQQVGDRVPQRVGVERQQPLEVAPRGTRRTPRRRPTPERITSASPATSSRRGSVRSVARSMQTAAGWWKAPMRFLPAGWSMATLPPTLESTCASSVVGHCTNGTPRLKVAAAKPARSPTTPPPSATTGEERSRWCSTKRSQRPESCATDLEASPSGTTVDAHVEAGAGEARAAPRRRRGRRPAAPRPARPAPRGRAPAAARRARRGCPSPIQIG